MNEASRPNLIALSLLTIGALAADPARLLIPAVEAHQRKLGRAPRLVAADAGYYSRANEETAHEMGVAYVSIPNRSTKSEDR